MRINLLAFGRAREIIGSKHLSVEINDAVNVSSLRSHLYTTYPLLAAMGEFSLAVNEEYITSETDVLLCENDEVAIIPPVCGG